MHNLLFLLLLFNNDIYLNCAKSMTLAGNYEASDDFLNIVNKKTADPKFYHFYRLVNAYSLNNKKVAEKAILDLTFVKDDLPKRHQNLLFLMEIDLKTWEPGLGNVARNMHNAETRLRNAKGGQITQKIQKDVVDELDKIIKKMEDDKNQADAKTNSEEGDSKGDGKEGGNQQKPQNDSLGGSEKGLGKIDEKKLNKLGQQWGKLPEKDKVKAMQEITKSYPPKYREIIENYFRKISRDDK